MKKLFSILLIILSFGAFSQNEIMVYSNGGMRKMNIKSKSKKAKASVHYSNEWQTGSIYLFSGEEIKNYPLKYDLRMEVIEIKLATDIKVIATAAIKKVEWHNVAANSTEVFMNCNNYIGPHNVGMYKIISEGKILFLKKTDLEVLESNYNPALSVGNKKSKYVKEAKYYISEQGKIKLIKKRKKRILKLFGDNAEKVEIFAKENNLTFRNETNLVKIFNYFNSI